MKRIICVVTSVIMIVVLSICVTADSGKEAEELEKRFYESVCIYSWFGSSGEMGLNGSGGFPNPESLHPSDYPEDFEKLLITEDGDYHVVLFDECNTKEKMLAFLKTYFSSETANDLLSSDAFTEHNGYLYEKRGNVSLTTVNKNDIKSVIVEFTSDDTAVISVEIDRYTADSNHVSKIKEYKVRRNSDNNWIFDPYELYLSGDDVNPQTADAPLIAVCAPALSALAAAVVLRKKRG